MEWQPSYENISKNMKNRGMRMQAEQWTFCCHGLCNFRALHEFSIGTRADGQPNLTAFRSIKYRDQYIQWHWIGFVTRIWHHAEMHTHLLITIYTPQPGERRTEAKWSNPEGTCAGSPIVAKPSIAHLRSWSKSERWLPRCFHQPGKSSLCQCFPASEHLCCTHRGGTWVSPWMMHSVESH